MSEFTDIVTVTTCRYIAAGYVDVVLIFPRDLTPPRHVSLTDSAGHEVVFWHDPIQEAANPACDGA